MPSTPQRRLAAIVFTDLVDFSLLSGKDENKALEVIQKQKEIVAPLLKEFKGTLHKETGDGLVLTFQTVTDAVKFSINLQKATKDLPDLNLRIGIHEGEITFKDNDILGDDVNITSRIEPFAAQGGIAISGKVQQNLLSLPEFETKYIGKPKLKGISQSIEVHCITSQGLPETNISEVFAKLEKEKSKYNIFTLTGGLLTIIGVVFWVSVSFFDILYSDENKEIIPSIGVLLMDNKGIEEDEFWAEMLTEELIYKISKAGMVAVTPIYKIINMDTSKTVKEITESMNLHYILSSSIYKNENNFDLFCNLIDANTGESKFIDKWTETKENTPKIVSNIAKNILSSINFKSNQLVEIIETNNSKAYEYWLKAKYKHKKTIEYPHEPTYQNIDILKNLLTKAIEYDNNLLLAKNMLIWAEIEEYLLNNDEDDLRNYIELINNKDYLKKIIDSFNKILKQAQDIKDKESIALIYDSLGKIYNDCHQALPDNKTLEYKTKALNIYKEIGDVKGISAMLNNIAVTYDENEEHEIALDYYIESVNIANQIGNLTDLENTLYGILYLENVKGDYDKLFEYYLSVYEFYKKFITIEPTTNSGVFVARFLNYSLIYDLYLHRGNFEKALFYLKDLEKYLNNRYEKQVIEKKDRELKTTKSIMLIVEQWKGNALLYRGDYDNAIKYYNQSLDSLRDSSSNYFSQLFLGISHFHNNDLENSIESFNKLIMQLKDDPNSNKINIAKYKALAKSWILILDSNISKNISLEYMEDIIRIINDENNDWSFSINMHGSGEDSFPLINYNIHKIYKSNGKDKLAKKYLTIAYNLIIKKTEQYTFVEAKDSFINNNPFHKEIVEEYNKIFKNK